MTMNRAVVLDCLREERHKFHEPWPRLGGDYAVEPNVWNLCPWYLVSQGRGMGWKIEPLVLALYADDSGGVFVPACTVEDLKPVKTILPVKCLHKANHYGKWEGWCGNRSVYSCDVPYDSRPPDFRWIDIWMEKVAFHGVCRRHIPSVLGIKPENRLGTTVRDFQRSRVYKWEDEVFPSTNTPTLSLDDSRELVHTIWDTRGPDEVPPPQVILGKSNGRSSGCREWIRLHPDHLNPIVTIHETAHALLGAAGSCDGHGPLFMRLFLELLERYAGEMPELAQDLKVASYQELAAVEALRGFDIAEMAAA